MNEKKLQAWWDGMSETERAEAKRAADAGRLEESTRGSLDAAGLPKEDTSDDEIVIFLKSRH